jgi:energy-coupling factor transporter ATP-binding protein EcfA2
MIAFPILKSLTIERYGLFPPSVGRPFVISFQPGPNAIIGVNGSGKTTLINIAMRCLTGPYNLPSSTSESEFGQVRPRVIPMSRSDRQLFGRRVADGAEEATATLIVALGTSTIEIKRRLSNLSLVTFSVDGQMNDLTSEPRLKQREDQAYQTQVSRLLGLATFFDVLIVLHFLVFMLEDRRALVWDPTAQRQIFRVLLLPSDRATEYATAQQDVISADSAVRNTNALIFRHESEVTAAKKRARTIADAEAERRVLSAEAEVLREKVDAAAQARINADKERHAARLDRLKAAETRESVVRELERMKLESLGSLLGPSQETLRYIVGHLLAEKRCLVCGTDPSPAAKTIDNWIRSGRCPICGSKHEVAGQVIPLTEAHRLRITRLESELSFAENQIVEAENRIASATGRFTKADTEFETLEGKRVNLDARIVAVLNRIPTERAAIGSRDSNIDLLRRMLGNEKRRLTRAEKRFRSIVAESVAQVQTLQEEIASSFQNYLQVFLKEQAELVYQTVKDQLGQSGASFEFPAFHLTMTGGAVAGQTMRDNPREVSQSQAEFVDLAFRMALMTVAAEGGPATLVVDAPEASLDFLFAERAGQQLAAFSRALPENRVIVTSYLPSDHLLRTFLESAKSERERRQRIVDLIRDAAPNAAMRADRAAYEQFLAQVVKGGSR